MLDHQILLRKLHRYGIQGEVHDWFESYLAGRSLTAKITTSPNHIEKSDRFDIAYGTAKSSCLGPLLFIIFVNDIHLLPLYSRIILFADDTTIFNSHTSGKYLQYMMEHDLTMMSDWFSANKLSLNLTKTVAMKFWNNTPNFRLRINNSEIPFVQSIKFLNVHLDSQLSWYIHRNGLIEKFSNNKQLLSLGKNLLVKSSLCSIYFGHIHSHLNYGLTVWGSMLTTSHLTDLWKIQKDCVNIVRGSSNTVLKSLRILSIDQMICNNLCKMGHRISHGYLPGPLLDIFNSYGGKKSQRCPTRNRHIPNIQKHHDAKFNKSFLCKSIQEFISLPNSLKHEKNSRRFDMLLKRYLFEI